MIPPRLQQLGWKFIKKSPYKFNILWSKENYMLIELTKKQNLYKNKNKNSKKIPDYDLEVNPFLLDNIYK